MGKSRVFFPQAVVDRWLAIGEAELTGAELWLHGEQRRYRVVESVRVVKEVTGTPDPFEIVGRVKTFGYVTELGAELLGDSMIIGDNAYETVPGWLGTPLSKGERLSDGQARGSSGAR